MFKATVNALHESEFLDARVNIAKSLTFGCAAVSSALTIALCSRWTTTYWLLLRSCWWSNVPLIYLYLKRGWPLRVSIPCLLIIPVLWYLTYSPLHELSHIAGTYLVGGRVTYYKLIPSFWAGEFGRAWIKTDGLEASWQQLVSTASPYILNIACVVTAIFIPRRNFTKKAFVVGLVFMLLCLRPAFDFVCETIAFISGDRGDIYYIEGKIGSLATWALLSLSIGLSLFSILSFTRRFVQAPNT